MAEQMAMFTARIPKSTKELVTEYLAQADYTPSQAFQVIWSFLARSTPDEVKAFFEKIEGSMDDEEAQKKRELRKRLEACRLTQERLATFVNAAPASIELVYCTPEELDEERYARLMDEHESGDFDASQKPEDSALSQDVAEGSAA